MTTVLGRPEPPVGREAEQATVFRPSMVAQRGGAAAVAALTAARRRGATMGSRVATGRVKEAVYPMFLELAKEAGKVDAHWKGFFETMAIGRFPKGVILRDDCLVHRARKKTSTFQLSAEARKDWQMVADFFRTVCDIRSNLDWQLRSEAGEVVVQLTTAQINKRVKKQHANAIPEFTLALKKRYVLSPAEMSEVDVMLRYYSTSNLFRPGDVVYNASGAIREIKTLSFDEATRRFTITAEAKAPRYATKESYQDPVAYLSEPPFTKPVQRKIGLDDDIRKQLRQLYSTIVEAREAAARQGEPKPKPKRSGKKTIPLMPAVVVPTVPQPPDTTAIPDEIVTDDDDDAPMMEVKRHRVRSDDDSE